MAECQQRDQGWNQFVMALCRAWTGLRFVNDDELGVKVEPPVILSREVRLEQLQVDQHVAKILLRDFSVKITIA